MILSKEGERIIIKHIKNTSKKNLKKHTCKYYRKELEVFDLDHLAPKGLCLDLYFAAYPYCLSLLYGACFTWEKDKNVVNAQCPAADGNVHFKVKRIPLKKQVISNGIKKNNKIIVEIIRVEKSKGEYENSCICPHETGEKFEFNQGDDLTQMCPAAFYNIYPNLKSMLNKGEPSWSKNGKVFMQCPDNISGIMFEITKENR